METALLTIVIAQGAGERLDKALAAEAPEAAGLSRSRIARLVGEGAIRVNGAVASSPKQKVGEGDRIEVRLAPEPDPEARPEAIALAIVHEDAEICVIDKPAGMVVHPAPGSPGGTLVNALLHHFGAGLSAVGGAARPGIVHRIDKETSGLLVVAKTDRAHQILAAQFERHSVHRHYLAVVHGAPDAADPRLRGVRGVSFEPGNVLKVQSFLGRHKTDRQRQAVSFHEGRHAITRARRLETFGAPAQAALLECWLETGRTHQIRVHLAHAGHGLVGDPVYGGRRRLGERALGAAARAAIEGFGRQALHAATLGFDHPATGARMDFEAPLPADMAALLAALRQG